MCLKNPDTEKSLRKTKNAQEARKRRHENVQRLKLKSKNIASVPDLEFSQYHKRLAEIQEIQINFENRDINTRF